ncbi:MAG: N-6 DNA methylase [Caldilineales bacterium]|nr:N-6 DNA methylase [Planctomycetales bacterium]MCW5856696.1 N-6 DNA methylase [Caldilineales bacterium]
MKKPDLNLDALRIEGSLLPAEFVSKLLELKADHQSATDYGIPPGLNLKDEVGRYWRIATALWADFKARCAKPGANPDKLALSHWLTPLFTRVLGFEAWTPTSGEEIDERRFPLTHKLGATPLLLVPHTVDLDRSDARFAPEGRRRSPHATIQELLNASHASLWGIVCNGHTLRILRDNPSLTRPAYIEADLARIFEEERYADFVALWLLAHGTRFGNGTDGHHEHLPILEHWHGQAQETGERALEKLRDGVTDALRQLGNGFLAHPANTELRAALNDSRLATGDFFKQLLRLVYRLILLHTAEDRGLLHAPNATPEQRELYAKGYSANLLRERALKSRADRHADLWQGLQVTLRGLANGAEPLGLPALGGLFSADKCPDLDAAELPNKALLAAVRALCFFRSGAVLARINYRDMDTEELGSVYESLLELQPAINVDANPWRFGFIGDEAEGEARGSARKLTGSYYTPDSLVQELIKSALEPKIAEALKAPDPRVALLALKVIDPASGSGHFLLAAARRIAAEVARLDAESDIPEAQAFRHALREVVAHCIYGVDLNPLAVELCQTALWLETLEPGKPLGFLDHHVRHGNSLVGILDPVIMKEGIPDKAYTALSGDDKATCTELKKTNKKQAGGRQAELFKAEVAQQLATTHAALDAMPEDTVEAIAAKRAAFAQAEADQQLAHERLRCDLFCAAFFAPKTTANANKVPLSGDLVRAAEGQPLRPGVAELTNELAEEYHFFHWRLAFPEVFTQGGFDVVLANPPWERIAIEDEEFFAERSCEIASTNITSRRKDLIRQLERDLSPIWQEYLRAKNSSERQGQFFSESGCFAYTARGRLNTYPLFSELIIGLLNADGVAGFIVPSGILTDAPMEDFCRFLFQENLIKGFVDFDNSESAFPAVHAEQKFSLVTLSRASLSNVPTRFALALTNVRQIHDLRRGYLIADGDLQVISPGTSQPVFSRTIADYELLRSIYRRSRVMNCPPSVPVATAWVAMTSAEYSNALIRDDEIVGVSHVVPVLEAKLINQFDCSFATFADVSVDQKKKGNPRHVELIEKSSMPVTRYFMQPQIVKDFYARKNLTSQWILGIRDVTNVNNERTAIAAICPAWGLLQPLNGITTRTAVEAALVLAAVNSLTLDFVARQRFSGRHLNVTTFSQLPFPQKIDDLDFIVTRVLELTYTAHDLAPFALDLGYDGPPFPWNPERRALLRAELDAYYAKLYGLTRDELRYILDPADIYGDDYPSETFRVLKNNETRQFGEYRTRRLVLEAWDRLASGSLI